MRWRLRTAKHPLGDDQNELESKREAIFTKRCNREQERSDREKLIASLDGELDIFHDICPPDKIKALSIVDERHAMEYRRTKLERKLLQQEERTLTKLLFDDMNKAIQELPQIQQLTVSKLI
jgi:hypothetical protein